MKKIKKDDAARLIPLENMLVRITQQDVVYRRYLDSHHRSYVPDFGVYIRVQGANGDVEYRTLSRQLVLFCVERRKAWRMLQSKAGIENREYKAQRALLADVDAGRISKEELFAQRGGPSEGADAGRRPRTGAERAPRLPRPSARRSPADGPARDARSHDATPSETGDQPSRSADPNRPFASRQGAIVMKRSASAVWKGGLKDGRGTVSTESGVLAGVPYNFSMRFENEKGTNPEELIAAAHAACFSMALSLFLGEAG